MPLDFPRTGKAPLRANTPPPNIVKWADAQSFPSDTSTKCYLSNDTIGWREAGSSTKEYYPILISHRNQIRSLLYPKKHFVSARHNSNLDNAEMVLAPSNRLVQTLGNEEALVNAHNAESTLKVRIQNALLRTTKANENADRSLGAENTIVHLPQHIYDWVAKQVFPELDTKCYAKTAQGWTRIHDAYTADYLPLIISPDAQRLLLYPKNHVVTIDRNHDLDDAEMLLVHTWQLAQKLGDATSLVRAHNEQIALKISFHNTGYIQVAQAKEMTSPVLAARDAMRLLPKHVEDWVAEQVFPARDGKCYTKSDKRWSPITVMQTGEYKPLIVSHRDGERVLLYPEAHPIALEQNIYLDNTKIVLVHPDHLVQKLGDEALLLQAHNTNETLKIQIDNKSFLRSAQAKESAGAAFAAQHEIQSLPDRVQNWIDKQSFPELDAKCYIKAKTGWVPIAVGQTGEYTPLIAAHADGRRILLYPKEHALLAKHHPDLDNAQMLLVNPTSFVQKMGKPEALAEAHNNGTTLKVGVGNDGLLKLVQVTHGMGKPLNARKDVHVLPQPLQEWIGQQSFPEIGVKCFTKNARGWVQLTAALTDEYTPFITETANDRLILLYSKKHPQPVQLHPDLNNAGIILVRSDRFIEKLGSVDDLVKAHNVNGTVKVRVDKDGTLKLAQMTESAGTSLAARHDLVPLSKNVQNWVGQQSLPIRDGKCYIKSAKGWLQITTASTAEYTPFIVTHKEGQRILLYPKKHPLSAHDNPYLDQAEIILVHPDRLVQKLGSVELLVKAYNTEGTLKVKILKRGFLEQVQVKESADSSLVNRLDILPLPQNVHEWSLEQVFPARDTTCYFKSKNRWGQIATAVTGNYIPLIIVHGKGSRVVLYPRNPYLLIDNNRNLDNAQMILVHPDRLAHLLGNVDAMVTAHNTNKEIKIYIDKYGKMQRAQLLNRENTVSASRKRPADVVETWPSKSTLKRTDTNVSGESSTVLASRFNAGLPLHKPNDAEALLNEFDPKTKIEAENIVASVSGMEPYVACMHFLSALEKNPLLENCIKDIFELPELSYELKEYQSVFESAVQMNSVSSMPVMDFSSYQ